MTNLLTSHAEDEAAPKKPEGGRRDEKLDVKEAGAGAAWLMSSMKCSPCCDNLKGRKAEGFLFIYLFNINYLIALLLMHPADSTALPGDFFFFFYQPQTSNNTEIQSACKS